MSTMISTRTRRYNQCTARAPNPIQAIKTRNRKGKRCGLAGWRKRRLILPGRKRLFELRKGAKTESFFGRAKALFNMRLRHLNQIAKSRPLKCEPHEHDWDNDGCNPEQCLKCGMGFTAYTFMECP